MNRKPEISDHFWELVLRAINRMEELELDEISVKGAEGIIVSREPKNGDNLELIDVLEIKGGKMMISYILYYVNDCKE